jgi:hypothetical protein
MDVHFSTQMYRDIGRCQYIRVQNQPFLQSSGATRRHCNALLCSGEFSHKASIAPPYYCSTRQLLFYIKIIKPVNLFFFRKLFLSVILHLYCALVERLAVGQFAAVPCRLERPCNWVMRKDYSCTSSSRVQKRERQGRRGRRYDLSVP